VATLAFAGGILPAPSALIVMLAAVQSHRVAYGLGLVLAFSLGLAVSLVIVGLGAMRARGALEGRLSGGARHLVPLLAAGAIVAVGLYVTARGLASF
jgi:nickel/cobalt exporter